MTEELYGLVPEGIPDAIVAAPSLIRNVLLGVEHAYPHAPPHPPTPNVQFTDTVPFVVQLLFPAEVITGACGAELTQHA